jgi:hypothetical protein
MNSRMIKWVGDPPILKPNGWTPSNWRYENSRTIAVPRYTSRIITPDDVMTLPDGRRVKKPNGLTREYVWHKNLPNFVLEVLDADARIILARQPFEFKDVTDMPENLWPTITNDPIIREATPPKSVPAGFVLPNQFAIPTNAPTERGTQYPSPYLTRR